MISKTGLLVCGLNSLFETLHGILLYVCFMFFIELAASLGSSFFKCLHSWMDIDPYTDNLSSLICLFCCCWMWDISNCLAVLRIHDILVWIRIRIHGSMPLTNGSGSGSCYFHHWPSRRKQKTNFLKKVFCLLLFEGTFTSFFKDNKSKRSHKTVEIKVFLTFFCSMVEGSGWIHISD